jgi:hypothetical protein
MSSDVLLPIVGIALALVLVGRRFWSRDVSTGKSLRLALMWAAIIAGLWLITSLIRS